MSNWASTVRFFFTTNSSITHRPPVAAAHWSVSSRLFGVNGDDHRRQGDRPNHPKRDRQRSPIPFPELQQGTIPKTSYPTSITRSSRSNSRLLGRTWCDLGLNWIVRCRVWRWWSWGRGRTRRATWAWSARPALRWASGPSISTSPRTSPRPTSSRRSTSWTPMLTFMVRPSPQDSSIFSLHNVGLVVHLLSSSNDSSIIRNLVLFCAYVAFSWFFLLFLNVMSRRYEWGVHQRKKNINLFMGRVPSRCSLVISSSSTWRLCSNPGESLDQLRTNWVTSSRFGSKIHRIQDPIAYQNFERP